MVASIASVEGQIKALARSNAELHQQLQDSKLDIQVMPGEAENDLAKENEKIAEVRISQCRKMIIPESGIGLSND